MSERGVNLKDWQIDAAKAGRLKQIRLPVVPQPPPLSAVEAMAGTDFRLFADDHTPGEFRVCGPVWAVREIMGSAYPASHHWSCPLGQTGDVLRCREAWATDPFYQHNWFHETGELQEVVYRADGDVLPDGWRWHTCPKTASRFAFTVTGVRVVQAGEMSEEDAEACGFDCWLQGHDPSIHTMLIESRARAEARVNRKDPVLHVAGLFRSAWDARFGERYPWAPGLWQWAVDLEAPGDEALPEEDGA